MTVYQFEPTNRNSDTPRNVTHLRRLFKMQTIKRWMIISLLILAVLPLVACGGSEEEAKEEPFHLEEIEGSDFNLVTLTEKAAERLDIQSEEVREEEVDGSVKMVVHYAAVLYGLNGETWAYVRNPEPDSLKFVRTPITIEYIDGGLAILSDGPDLGTHVVTVGAPELFGADTGVGK
jgi:hypothetical protein